LSEHDDVITLLLRGVPHLDLALGPAPATADPGTAKCWSTAKSSYLGLSDFYQQLKIENLLLSQKTSSAMAVPDE